VTERLDHPAWQARIAKLASVMTKPMKAHAIVLAATVDFGWGENFTINVLAAGERKAFYSVGDIWHLTGAVKPDRYAKTTRVEPTFGQISCRECGESVVRKSGRQLFCSESCRCRHARKKGAAA
jgi:hypothetical protein